MTDERLKPSLPSCEELAWVCGRLATGYLLIHLNFNLNLGGGALDLLPDWLGFWMMANALPRLAVSQPSALLIRPLALLLTGWDGLEWAANALDVSADALPLLPLVMRVVSLYFHYQLLTNVADAVESRLPDRSGTLRTLRTVQTLLLTVFSVLSPWLADAVLGQDAVGWVSLALLLASVCVAFALWGQLRGCKKELLAWEGE